MIRTTDSTSNKDEYNLLADENLIRFALVNSALLAQLVASQPESISLVSQRLSFKTLNNKFTLSSSQLQALLSRCSKIARIISDSLPKDLNLSTDRSNYTCNNTASNDAAITRANIVPLTRERVYFSANNGKSSVEKIRNSLSHQYKPTVNKLGYQDSIELQTEEQQKQSLQYDSFNVDIDNKNLNIVHLSKDTVLSFESIHKIDFSEESFVLDSSMRDSEIQIVAILNSVLGFLYLQNRNKKFMPFCCTACLRSVEEQFKTVFVDCCHEFCNSCCRVYSIFTRLERSGFSCLICHPSPGWRKLEASSIYEEKD